MQVARLLYPRIASALTKHSSLLSITSSAHVRQPTQHAAASFSSITGRRNFVTDNARAHIKPTATLTALPIKKRPAKKKSDTPTAGFYNVTAYATAEEYDLDRLRLSLLKENLYQLHELPQPVSDADHHHGAANATTTEAADADFLYVRARIQLDAEPREIFFFREGSVVLWNCSELECSNVLAQLKHCELDSYDRRLVAEESDSMAYRRAEHSARLTNGNFLVSSGDEAPLEMYTFANALSTSVKLGIWEAALDRYVDSMAYVTADLKRGAKIRMSRAEVLRKTGELFALRHTINLSSDLLDTPDFYWDREQLEGLYSKTCGHFSVQRRTKVMNEKLSHCIELADLVASNLNDIHHVRLEWMIIILIMVEVAFEMIHLADKFL